MLQELFAHLTQSSCWCCHCAGGAAELPCFHSEPRRGGGSPGEPPPPPPAVRSVRGCPCTAEASEASTGRSHGIQFDLEVQWGSRLGFQCPICQLSSTLEADESAVVFPSWLGSAVCVQRSERE